MLDHVDPEARATLERFGFDESGFELLRQRVATGELSAASNVVSGVVEPVEDGDIVSLPSRDDPAYAEAYGIGLATLVSGQVAHLVLAGGMATRFGGVVKATVEALDGRSFLEIAMGETTRLGRALDVGIPIVLMTSFATDDVVRGHVADSALGDPIVFSQFVAPRLEPSGELFRGEAGRVSLYGPGHGDLVAAVGSSGALAELDRRGVRHLVVANVDNLAARIDPAVIGAHVLAGRPLTLEVARSEGDVGGTPARVNGRPMMLEGPRMPPGFAASGTSMLNTNTGILDLDLLGEEHDLTWLYVEREVDGRRAVQLEHLYHELSAHVPTTFLAVPRGGPSGRFLPVKTPEDLDRVADELRALLATPIVD